MLRIAMVTCLLAAAVVPTASFASRANDAPAGPALVAKVVSCDVTSSDRSATFYGRMDAVPGTAKMQIRFQLLERLGKTDPFDKLDVPALRQWHTSGVSVQRYGWKQTVDNLHVGGAYKAHIQYRWLSASGAVIQTDQRDTPTCRGPLPNIVVGDLTINPGPTSDTRVYKVLVSNKGKLGADGVDVQLAVDKAVLDTITLSHLAVGEARSVSFNGPACNRFVRVTADPGNSIGESIEDDNSQLFACS